MAIYLLDFENVHDSGIAGITALSENDELYIFYSVKSEHMSFETHVNIMKTSAKVRYIKLMRAAKNYLDFQLCTHLGYIIGAGFEGPFYIISKDTGYDSAIDYWKDHGVTIIRQPSIGFNRNSGKSTGQNPAHKTPPALVTFKQGGQVTTPDVAALYQMDTGKIPADDDTTVSSGSAGDEGSANGYKEPAEIRSEETGVKEMTEDPAAAEADSAQKAADTEDEAKAASGRSTRQTRSRKSSSKKPAKASETEAAPESPAPAAEVPDQAAEQDRSAANETSAAEAPSAKPAKTASKSGKSGTKKAASDDSDKAAVQSEAAGKQENASKPKTASKQENASKPENAAKKETASKPENTVKQEITAKTDMITAEKNAEKNEAAAEDTADLAEAKPETLPESFRKRVRAALKGKNMPSAYYSSIYKAIINSYDKLALNNLLVKTFGSSRGGEVYKLIKDVFIDYQS